MIHVTDVCNPDGGNNGLLNTAELTNDGETKKDCDCEDLPELKDHESSKYTSSSRRWNIRYQLYSNSE